MKNIFFCFSAAVLFFLSPLSCFALDKPFDHSSWDQFLKTYVNDQGMVNYTRVQKEPQLLEAYLLSIEKIPKKDFMAWPREEKLALYLNLYHAAVIHQIVRNYPIKTIQEVPGVWDLPAAKIAGKTFSLNQLRDSELIGQFRDEKIDAALSFGAKGAPKLRQEAYTGPRVEGQLYIAARDFVNDESKNPIRLGKKNLHISRIFKWYAPHFKLDFGYKDEEEKFSLEENSVLAFLAYYLNDRSKIEFLESKSYKIKYLTFDWSLNDWQAAPAAASP